MQRSLNFASWMFNPQSLRVQSMFARSMFFSRKTIVFSHHSWVTNPESPSLFWKLGYPYWEITLSYNDPTCKLLGNGWLPLSRLVAFGSGQPLHWCGLDSPRRNLSGKKCCQHFSPGSRIKPRNLLKFLEIPEKKVLSSVFTKGVCKQFQGMSILWKWSWPWQVLGKTVVLGVISVGGFCFGAEANSPKRWLE